MRQTIFILGTDPEQCAELRNILQAGISDTIVTASVGDPMPRLTESDTVIITTEERNTGVLYRHLLNRLEDQVHRAQILGELVRLSLSTLSLDEVLERVVTKATEVLGDTSFIVLTADEGFRLEATYSSDPDRLKRMMMMAINASPQSVAFDLLRGVLDKGEAVVVSNLQQAKVPGELQSFVEKHSLLSLIATPIRSKDRILGALISTSTAPRMLVEQDLAPASELADFTAMVIENARLVAELQRSATTDPLTGVYNTRFFHEVLNRETARAQRYRTPLSLLMIDVDSFKIINDTYGHVVGDKVLLQVGQILESSVRTTDLVFRCGGDEFGVVLPGTNAEGAVHVAQKILERVQAGAILQSLGYAGALTVSIGVAEYQRSAPSESLVANADQALYTSKRSSKNTVRVFRKDQ